MVINCPKCGIQVIVHLSYDPRFGKISHCKKTWVVKDGKPIIKDTEQGEIL